MAELRIGVLTCSDPCAADEAGDVAGRDLISACEAQGWQVIAYHVCPGEAECVSTSLLELADLEDVEVVFTIGGIGLGPRDVTPDVTQRVSERLVPGIAEALRAGSSRNRARAMLSRAVAGVRGRTLIVNLGHERDEVLDEFALLAPVLVGAVGQVRAPVPEDVDDE